MSNEAISKDTFGSNLTSSLCQKNNFAMMMCE